MTTVNRCTPRINRVLDHIADNLAGDLSLKRLAAIAHCSKFHSGSDSRRWNNETIDRHRHLAALGALLLNGSAAAQTDERRKSMNLGTFSISLTVEDLEVSRAFYEKLGFELVPGEGSGGVWEEYEKTWVILKNDSAIIGLFHGMFEENILTFNPTDVRSIQKALKEQEVEFTMEADESTTGPAAAMVTDPDGNQILLDQHNE